MYSQSLSISSDPATSTQQCTTMIQPYVASTHFPAYSIIIATPRPKVTAIEEQVKPIRRSSSSSSSSSSTSSSPSSSSPSSSSSIRMSKRAAVTQENLRKIAIATAHDEHLDVPSPHWRSASSTSVNSTSSSCLPSIHEEDELV